MKENREDKIHTLRATESILEYLTHDVGLHGLDGLVFYLNGGRSYCADLLRFIGEEADPGTPPDTDRPGEPDPASPKGH